MKKSVCVVLRALCACMFLSARFAIAQPVATGTIEGRVFNPANGEYIERARVTVEGTTLEAFTDSSGQYRLTQVPAGTARVKVFFTGLDAQTVAVELAAGATTQRDFDLAVGPGRAPAAPGRTGEIVKLTQFVVATTKEMDAAAIAINEQRFAANIVNVVSADEFGAVVEGNAGDFLKFLPGITVDTGGGDMRTISMNGVPANNVPITVAGFSLASAASSGTSRQIELEQTSVNNVARFEVHHSPTPESPGSALAGSINLVPRSAFERSRPVFNTSVFLMMKDNYKELKKTPGPRVTPTYKIRPGFDFSWVVPVNKRFGFTMSGAHSNQYTSEDYSQIIWRGVSSTTNGGTLPDTTVDKPYVTDYAVQDANKFSKRTSFGVTADYKLARNDRVSFSFQWAFFDAELSNRMLTFLVGGVAPGNFDTGFTHGNAGAGTMRLNNSGMRQKSGTTYTPTLTYRHDGPVWKAELGLGNSHASNHYRDEYRGFFNNSVATRSGVTVNFDDNFYLRPGRITVTDATGRAVDPYSLANYSLTSASMGDQESMDLQRSAFANLRRDLVVRGIPLALKAGFEMKQSVRDIRKFSPSWSFVGADGRTSTTPIGNDDSAAVVLDETFSQRTAPYGFGKIQWVQQEALYSLYKAHPEYFAINTANNAYRSLIDQSKHAAEIISSAYLRADVAFLDRRLKFVGGLRMEQTNVKAEGPLTDPTLNFQRDASGRVIDGNPNLAGVQTVPIVPASDALGVSRLTYIDRGYHAQKEYLRYYPNLNASYNLRENLIARVSLYTSIGRPNFDQYSGGVTLPNTEALPASNNRIAVSNVAIKPWSANTAKVRLEYYFQRVGAVSVGAYRRDFKNFFGSTVFDATPEFLELYNLDPAEYGPYQVSTSYNLTSRVRMEGLEADYKQALTFLPEWARGVQVFANASAQRTTGDGASNFQGFVPRSGSWGVSLSRPKFNVKLNWNCRSPARLGAVTGRGIEAGTYEWRSKKMLIDLYGDYALTRRIGLFASLRNINSAPEDVKRFGPSTPAIARFRQRQDYGSAWIFGAKGTF
ncbi:MAG: carboxypeptidase regulatory-like domain-containing protein [Verrucomicrobia bacterium]|nr:carboxypeptidase regulatory-like domain-containing protein [Verrucomicrobiota bacterium]